MFILLMMDCRSIASLYLSKTSHYLKKVSLFSQPFFLVHVSYIGNLFKSPKRITKFLMMKSLSKVLCEEEKIELP